MVPVMLLPNLATFKPLHCLNQSDILDTAAASSMSPKRRRPSLASPLPLLAQAWSRRRTRGDINICKVLCPVARAHVSVPDDRDSSTAHGTAASTTTEATAQSTALLHRCRCQAQGTSNPIRDGQNCSTEHDTQCHCCNVANCRRYRPSLAAPLPLPA